MIDVDAALLYTDFVEERHRVWELRQAGAPQPWTENPILAGKKFTNVFRVLDPGSQFVFELAEPEMSKRTVLMRLFLYRHTNLPSAWQAYRDEVGHYPIPSKLDELRAFWHEYRQHGHKVFSGAYMVYPQSSVPGTNKVDSIIELTDRLFQPDELPRDFFEATDQRGRFEALRQFKGVADFMSMQILTDWGYTEHCGEDLEDRFVVAGPGAKRGAKHLEPGWKPGHVIRWCQDAVHASPSCPKLPNGRKPSMMDIQNTLCEFSKYMRYVSSPPREQAYRPAHPGVQSSPVLPQHWH